MPDGTIVTTVTTVQSRPRVDGKLGKKEEPESPALVRGTWIADPWKDKERARKVLVPTPPSFRPHLCHFSYYFPLSPILDPLAPRMGLLHFYLPKFLLSFHKSLPLPFPSPSF